MTTRETNTSNSIELKTSELNFTKIIFKVNQSKSLQSSWIITRYFTSSLRKIAIEIREERAREREKI